MHRQHVQRSIKRLLDLECPRGREDRHKPLLQTKTPTLAGKAQPKATERHFSRPLEASEISNAYVAATSSA